MEYNDCVACGFKCEKVCPVSRGTKKYCLRAFLEKYLGQGEAISWPCMGCRACELVCPGEKKPHQLVIEAMQRFLKTGENTITDYHAEFTERGRIGVSRVFLDDLVLPGKAIGKHPFLRSFDRIVVFPGCVVSSRFPGLVYRLYQLLVLLGTDPKRIAVEDDSCCGSFLHQVDEVEHVANASSMLKQLLSRASRVLVVTACGSCTSTLRERLEALQQELAGKTSNPFKETAILHYMDLLSFPETRKMLRPLVKREKVSATGDGKVHVYVQYPCQATTDPSERAERLRGIDDLLAMLGYEPTRIEHDLGCCGSSLLDTHPDVAIEYGIRRIMNINEESGQPIDSVILGCGNCHRMYVDFKPSLAVECDGAEAVTFRVQFLLDIVMESIE